jgi:hypothetical protein
MGDVVVGLIDLATKTLHRIHHKKKKRKLNFNKNIHL